MLKKDEKIKHLDDIRKDKFYTQQTLADKLGVKQSTVAMWETGKARPAMKNIIKLSQLFNLTIDEICKSLNQI